MPLIDSLAMLAFFFFFLTKLSLNILITGFALYTASAEMKSLSYCFLFSSDFDLDSRCMNGFGHFIYRVESAADMEKDGMGFLGTIKDKQNVLHKHNRPKAALNQLHVISHLK